MKEKRSWKPERTEFEFWFWSCHLKDRFVSFSKNEHPNDSYLAGWREKVRQPPESTWRVVGVAHVYIVTLLPLPSLFLVLLPFQIQLASLGINMASLKPSAGRCWWMKVETKPRDFALSMPAEDIMRPCLWEVLTFYPAWLHSWVRWCHCKEP